MNFACTVIRERVLGNRHQDDGDNAVQAFNSRKGKVNE